MKLIDVVQRLKLINDYDQCKAAMNDAITEIESLRESNNRLREALIVCKQYITEAIIDDKYHEASCGLDEIYNLRDKAIKLYEAATSATPAESLQAFENEVIEKCAKVLLDKSLELEKKAGEFLEDGDWDEVDNQRAIAWIISVCEKQILSMKGK